MSGFDTFFSRRKAEVNEFANFQKTQILTQLNLCSKEINYNFSENSSSRLEVNEITITLCSIIEAIFLHGLKDSLLRKTFNVFADDDRRPEINFWPPLLIISHKHIIEKIQNLTQVHTDIGYCRSWIRFSLNDSLLSSYLNTIGKNNSIISSYYQSSAFIRDIEMVEMTEKIIEGLEAVITFDLAANSSLLNNWTDWTLEIAGVWFAPIKNLPITSGFDIASSLPVQSIASNYITDDVDEVIIAEEEEDLKNENECIAKDDYTESDNKIETPQNLNIQANEMFHEDSDLNMSNSHSMGNSIISRTGWSSSHDRLEEAIDLDNQEQINKNQMESSSTFSRMNSMTNSITSPIDKHSFNTLLEKYENRSIYNKQKLSFNELWERFESTLEIDNDVVSTATSSDQNSVEHFIGNELIRSGKYTIEELQTFVEQSCKLAHEPGLDAQGYICKSCVNPLGVGFSKAQVCLFSGNYFCDSCMSPDLYAIPAKIIYNWDFKKYSVSINSASFLNDFQHKPFIDLKLLNPAMYTAIEEMADLQTLRIQLNFIRAYLYTCCEKIIKKFQEIMDKKDYYHEHVYRYSINDLLLIPKGKLCQMLEKAVSFGRNHILECPLCSQKGFICEICDSPKVLYPFDCKNTYRCDSCGTIFHEKCLNPTKPCPKCDRKKKRQDFPLLDVGNDINSAN